MWASHMHSSSFFTGQGLVTYKGAELRGRSSGFSVSAKKGFAKKQDAAPTSNGKGSKQRKKKMRPGNILAPAPPSPNSRNEQFEQRMDSMQEGTLEDNLEFEKRLEKLRKQGEVVQRRTKAAAESSGPLTAGPLASPLEPPSPSKPAAKKEDTSPVGVPQVAVGVISLALAVVLVVTSVGGGGDPVTTADVQGMTSEQRQEVEARIKELEGKVKASPEDVASLRELSDLSALMGQYKKSRELAEQVTKADPKDSQAWLALADARGRLSDFRGAATAYEKSLEASSAPTLGQLQGLAGALAAEGKQAEAVQKLQSFESAAGSSGAVGTVELQLLIGKVYSQWDRHFASALAVYDGIIEKYPDDFRGYLAKGALLKENGRKGDAQRMFIQARFLAPPEARTVVDQVSTR